MQTSSPTSNAGYPSNIVEPAAHESRSSGVSWGAVLAGAFVAAALSLILVALGTGLGLSAISPWANAGASATTIGIGAVVWLVLMQLISSAMGGYIAGRLRTKWVSVHTDEVFFRDTAHGFLVWAVGLVITAAFLTSAATSLIGGAAKVAATSAATVAGAAGTGAAAGVANEVKESGADPTAYFVDALFRANRPATPGDNASTRQEIGRIFATGLRQGNLSASDRTYVVQVVAARTGLSQADAEKRVSEVIDQAKAAEAKARQAADTARKAAAQASLWTFVALLIGAFCASYAATIGGRQRDNVTT